MGFLDWLLGSPTPPPPPRVARVAGAGRLAAVLDSTGRLVVWDVQEDRVVLDRDGAGHRVAVSAGGRVAGADGVVHDCERETWRSPIQGIPCFIGEECLILGWKAWVRESDGELRQDERVDPSALTRLPVDAERVALIDPSRAEVVVIGGEGVTQIAGKEPVVDGAWVDGWVSVTRGRDTHHRVQTLAMAMGPTGVATLGVDKGLELRVDATRVALPGPVPFRPQLIWSDFGWIAQTGRGFCLVADGMMAQEVELPLCPDPLVLLAGGLLLVGGDPAAVYELGEGRWRGRLTPPKRTTQAD